MRRRGNNILCFLCLLSKILMEKKGYWLRKDKRSMRSFYLFLRIGYCYPFFFCLVSLRYLFFCLVSLRYLFFCLVSLRYLFFCLVSLLRKNNKQQTTTNNQQPRKYMCFGLCTTFFLNQRFKQAFFFCFYLVKTTTKKIKNTCFGFCTTFVFLIGVTSLVKTK